VAQAVPDGGQAARLEPFVLAVRQALQDAVAGIASPAGISLDDLAVSAVVAVLSEAYLHPGLFPGAAESASSVDDVLGNLVTRRQIAARRDVSISTMMSWIDRYQDFPGPVLGAATRTPYYYWPAVLAYLDFKQLPRRRQESAALEAEDRDAKVREMLVLFPDGLTAAEMAALSGEEGPGGDPTPWAVQVRYEDRLLRMEASGEVRRAPRSGNRRSPQRWMLAGAPAEPGHRTVASSAVTALGFTGTAAAAATRSRPKRRAAGPGPAVGETSQAPSPAPSPALPPPGPPRRPARQPPREAGQRAACPN
jgi:hypothetical protein